MNNREWTNVRGPIKFKDGDGDEQSDTMPIYANIINTIIETQ